MLFCEAEYIHYRLLLRMCTVHIRAVKLRVPTPHMYMTCDMTCARVLIRVVHTNPIIHIPAAHRLPRPRHLPRLSRLLRLPRPPSPASPAPPVSPASVVFPASPALASAVLLTTLPAWPTRSHTMLPAWIHNVHTHSHPGPLDHTHNAPSLAHPITHTPSPRARRGSAAC